jgi:hypothetical protein
MREYVARMDKIRTAYKNFVRKPGGKRPRVIIVVFLFLFYL